MARHKNVNPTQVWCVKLSLVPGVDDDLIALRRRTPRGDQAMSIKHLIRSGGLPADVQPTKIGQGAQVEDDPGDDLDSWVVA